MNMKMKMKITKDRFEDISDLELAKCFLSSDDNEGKLDTLVELKRRENNV